MNLYNWNEHSGWQNYKLKKKHLQFTGNEKHGTEHTKKGGHIFNPTLQRYEYIGRRLVKVWPQTGKMQTILDKPITF